KHAHNEFALLKSAAAWAQSVNRPEAVNGVIVEGTKEKLVFEGKMPAESNEKKHVEERSEILSYLTMTQFFAKHAKDLEAKGLDPELVAKRKEAYEKNLARRADGEVWKTIQKYLEARTATEASQDEQAVAGIFAAVKNN